MFLKLLATLRALRKNPDRGATAVEYGLMVALIALIIMGAVALLGGNLAALFNTIAAAIAP
ncbi:MAG TPA: Flp family type IVb pilin [Micromonosporaceae bacterium]